MDAFNIVAGIVTILAAAFSVGVHFRARSQARVETQRASEYRRRLSDLSELTVACGKQINLLVAIADRPQVSKKELKHLAVASMATLESLQATIGNMSATEARWRFGVPDDYQRVHNSPDVSGSAASRAIRA